MITTYLRSWVTDAAVFTKQKRMQAMIITSHSDRVIGRCSVPGNKLHRGATVIHGAEGTYNYEQKPFGDEVITRAEFNEFKQIMKNTDSTAFVSVADNVHILGLLWRSEYSRFFELGNAKSVCVGFVLKTSFCDREITGA